MNIQLRTSNDIPPADLPMRRSKLDAVPAIAFPTAGSMFRFFKFTRTR